MTEAETILWSQIKNNILGAKFRRQYSVNSFILDFYCPKLKLAIEIDGEIHDIPKQASYDIERQKIIETRKIKFLRFTNDQIKYDLYNVLNTIKTYIANNFFSPCLRGDVAAGDRGVKK
jgi:very-short-patch-repair endonuclease